MHPTSASVPVPHLEGGEPDLAPGSALRAMLLDEHERVTRPRLERLWAYYRNPMTPASVTSSGGRAYRLAQEAGLPPRLTGRRTAGGPPPDDRGASRREIVIENDIAWRVQTMVDFMFGKPVRIESTIGPAGDVPRGVSGGEPGASRRGTIEAALDRVWEKSGGIALLQDMALLGHVYGHVDLLLRVDWPALVTAVAAAPALGSAPGALADAAAEHLRIELVEPRRGVPVPDPHDYRRLRGYLIRADVPADHAEAPTAFDRLVPALRPLFGGAEAPAARRASTVITETITPTSWRVDEDDRLIREEALPWTDGRLPVVHVQNIAQPFEHAGASEVEPLIPLQDELNTRLSDRASRVTMQSFKMYLAKGLDGFEGAVVGPGQIWSTDNPDASVQAFGGDGQSPSEESHIAEVRQALDKISGVPPLASGVVQAKIGNLSSANALRITLMGILSKTARKRVTYGRGIAEMSALILTALDAAGALRTTPAERGVRLRWPDPLPEDERERAFVAEAKARLGVPRAEVLRTLGDEGGDAGVT